MKKLIALVITIALMGSVLCTATYAASATDAQDATSYYFGNAINIGQYVDADGSITFYETRPLSSAQKISSLLSVIYPVDRLAEELEWFEQHNDPDYARYFLQFSGKGTLDSYLGYETGSALSVICPRSAYELMLVMRKMPEYANPEVKYIVDTYLQQTLSGDMIKWGLKVLTGANLDPQTSQFDEMKPSELIQAARDVVSTEEYQALLVLTSELRRGNADNYALTCRYTPDELDTMWSQLATAAKVYWPGYVNLLDNMQFVVPLAHPVSPNEGR